MDNRRLVAKISGRKLKNLKFAHGVPLLLLDKHQREEVRKTIAAHIRNRNPSHRSEHPEEQKEAPEEEIVNDSSSNESSGEEESNQACLASESEDDKDDEWEEERIRGLQVALIKWCDDWVKTALKEFRGATLMLKKLLKKKKISNV